MTLVRRETLFLLIGDLTLFVFSLWIALTLRALEMPTVLFFYERFVPFTPVFCISLIVFFIAGLYEKQTRLVKRSMGSRILSAQVANTGIAAVIFFVLPLAIAPKTVLLIYLVISVLLIQAWRFYITPHFGVQSRQSAVLVGTGQAVQEVYEEVNGNNRYHIFFSAFVDTSNVTLKDISTYIREAVAKGARYIIVDTRDTSMSSELPALYDAMVKGISFMEFASFYEDLFDKVPLAHIDYAWLFACLPKRHLAYDFGKRAFDIIGAAIGILIAAFFIIPASSILLIQGGQPFIFHERIGRGGKTFRIVKLRTMLFNDHGDPIQQKNNRVTSFGKFLRKTRIDELPQLYNILIGDLSFIGPRPELPNIATVYQKEIPYYEIRHVITPGLSGWAQIHDFDAPKGGADVLRTERKLSYDLFYLKHRSFALDIVITLKTIRALLSFSGI